MTFSIRAGCVLALAAAAAAARAGDAQAVEGEPMLLGLPASTRARAMGDAYVGVPDNDAVFYNPALLAPGSARGASASVERYGSASTLGSLSMAMALPPGGLGVGVQLLDYGAGCPTCLARPGGRETALAERGGTTASQLAALLGFGASVRSGIFAGIAAKYVEQRIGEARDGSAAIDVGLATGLGPFFLGLAAQNLGPAFELAGERARLPRRFGLGAAALPIPFGMFDLSAAVSVAHERGRGIRPGAGVEVGYVPLEGYSFIGRVGARRTTHGVSPLSLGAAISVDRVAVEYAFQPVNGSGDAHRVGLRVR